MFKILIFAKRAPGLTREQFIERYESVHIPLTNDLVSRGALPPLLSYKRNYVQHDNKNNIGSLEFDVVTEACFADEATFLQNRVGLEDPEIAKIVMEDMQGLLDLSDVRYIVVDEHAGGGAAPA